MTQLFGSAGNNNEPAPIVKKIKFNLKTQHKEGDIDIIKALAIKDNIEINISESLQKQAEKLIKKLYQEIYLIVDSEVNNDRIKQLEQENEILINQNIKYYKQKMNFIFLEKFYEEASNNLIENNRLLDLQKVAEGKARVREI